MVLSLRSLRTNQLVSCGIENALTILTLLLVIAVAALIASSFVGDSHSPYGTCYAPSGRTIPCDAIEKRR
jgi:hypothetical protein